MSTIGGHVTFRLVYLLIGQVRVAGVAADRIRIASSGKLQDTLSAQHLISCNRDRLQRGCQGGHLDRAWWYLRHYGYAHETFRIVAAACVIGARLSLL